MYIKALIDIDVDLDFGLAKALRISNSCDLKKILSDSVKHVIHTVITENIEDKVKCLSSIKGFFTVDLRLFMKLCKLDRNTLKSLGIKVAPKTFYERSKIIGYTYADNKLCIVEKTSKDNIVLVRVLKSKMLPIFVEPSLYLISAPNTEIVDKVLEILNILKTLNKRFSTNLVELCREIA
ncbi:MAG: hypothetical protein QW775_01555 [Ignisphaera sp.]|uniref:Uncharacterized protein n=1 Tax=Ignisphaera aggregans TaxID=334771 RepID=A0A7C4JLC9_9CREN